MPSEGEPIADNDGKREGNTSIITYPHHFQREELSQRFCTSMLPVQMAFPEAMSNSISCI